MSSANPEADLLARMDWLIGAAPAFDHTNATDPSVRGPGYDIEETHFVPVDPRVVDCEGCMCPVLNMPPCQHCEEHYDLDGVVACDADA